MIDLQGQLVIPGFIEGHGHFTGVGEAQLELNLMNDDELGRDRRDGGGGGQDRQAGRVDYGRGWHQEKWTIAPEPERRGLSDARVARRGVAEQSRAADARQRPRELRQRQGDGAVGHQRAPRRNPAGGEILKDATGDPTGLLRETASERSSAHGADAGERRRATAQGRCELASQEALSKGITSFQDAGSSFATIDLMKQMIDEGKIGVRLWVMVREGNAREAPRLAQYRTIDYGNGHLTVRAIKRQIDGALGSRGAWLLEPYTDKPDSVGLEHDARSPRSTRPRGWRWRTATSCACTRSATAPTARRSNIFEQAFKANPAKQDLRWRVEHAQHLSAAGHPALRPARRDRVDAGDPLHVGRAVRARRGSARQRAEEGAYVWQKLMKSGAVVANGTDAPVEDVDPIAELLRDRQPEDEGRHGVLPRSAHEPRWKR